MITAFKLMRVVLLVLAVTSGGCMGRSEGEAAAAKFATSLGYTVAGVTCFVDITLLCAIRVKEMPTPLNVVCYPTTGRCTLRVPQ